MNVTKLRITASVHEREEREKKIGCTKRRRTPKPETPFILLFPGNPGLRLRPEGPAEAASEALQPADPRGRLSHPEPVEVLRRGQELQLQGHVEDTPQGANAELE